MPHVTRAPQKAVPAEHPMGFQITQQKAYNRARLAAGLTRRHEPILAAARAAAVQRETDAAARLAAMIDEAELPRRNRRHRHH